MYRLDVLARPRPRFAGHAPIFSVRPWSDSDGDPLRPQSVGAREVIEQLRTRHDRPGALVALEDGRYAVTGALLIVGSAGQVQRQARKCLAHSDDRGDRWWWQEVIGSLAT
jgi:cell volume regulation protein A